MVRARSHLVGKETLLGNLCLLGNGYFQHDYGYKEVPLTTDAMRKIFKDNASEKSEQIMKYTTFLLYFTVNQLDPEKFIHMISQNSSLKFSRIKITDILFPQYTAHKQNLEN